MIRARFDSADPSAALQQARHSAADKTCDRYGLALCAHTSGTLRPSAHARGSPRLTSASKCARAEGRSSPFGLGARFSVAMARLGSYPSTPVSVFVSVLVCVLML